MGHDVEDPLAGSGGFEFSDKSIRQGFIRKVYGILMVQLLFTFGLISFFVFHEPTRSFAQKNRWLTYVAMGVTFVTMIIIACCGEVIFYNLKIKKFQKQDIIFLLALEVSVNNQKLKLMWFLGAS